MNDCIFCKIIEGEIPSHKIYEDDLIVAFLDIKPINPGHVLVVPKVHIQNFYDLEDNVYQALMNTVKILSKRIQERLSPQKTGVILAGWDVPHTHVHIVPMNDYHDITSKKMLEGTIAQASDTELEGVARKLME